MNAMKTVSLEFYNLKWNIMQLKRILLGAIYHHTLRLWKSNEK